MDYTYYQRRQALEALVDNGEAKDIFEAAEQFKLLEFSDPDTAAKLCHTYEEAPK